MTIDEFIEELKATGIKFYLEDGKYIRTRDLKWCPICALAYYKNIREVRFNNQIVGIRNSAFKAVGTQLGLAEQDAYRIASAADDHEGANVDWVRYIRGRLIELVVP